MVSVVNRLSRPWRSNRASDGIPHPRNQALKTVFGIEGQISKQECELLFELASQVTSGCIVEIGSFRGRSTVALGLGSLSKGGVPVYAIDPHESFTGVLGHRFGPQDRTAFFQNILRAGVSEVVRLVNLPSAAAARTWDQPISLLWIDGDHRYEAVRQDVHGWEPFLVIGGMVAFDDSIKPELGPFQVIGELLRSGRFVRVRQVGPATVLQKRG